MATLISKKGFTLPELLVVMVIIAILAASSTPFVRGYIRDARNGKAKAALVQLGEAYKTFKSDYPNAHLSSGGVGADMESRSDCPAYNGIVAATTPNVLVNCRYLRPLKWGHM